MTVSCIDGTFDCVYEGTVNVPTLFVPTGSLIVRYVFGGLYDSKSNLKFVSFVQMEECTFGNGPTKFGMSFGFELAGI